MLPLIACALAIVVILRMAQFHWGRRKLYECAMQCHGPLALPLVGNAYSFTCHHMEIFQRLRSILSGSSFPMRFWLGPRLVVFFSDIKHVEKIMSSTKLAHKSDVYKCLADFVGTGLVSGSGTKWKEDRRQIQPMFSLKFSYFKIDMIHEHVDTLIPILEESVDKGLVDVYPMFHNCCFDITAEIIYGLKADSQHGCNLEVSHGIQRSYQNAYERMTKPWLQFGPTYFLSECRAECNYLRKLLFDFGLKELAASNERLKDPSYGDTKESLPIIDQLNQIVANNDLRCTQDEFLHQMMTLFTATEDTLSITSSILIVCFAMYQEHQEKALQEIHEILGPNPRNVTSEDLRNFKYLDMCIKDAVRLATIAPTILRKCNEEMLIGEYMVAPGCEVAIPIFEIHRDPELWENPHHFHPEHFSEASAKKRNPYAYLAFSAGPRSCIGKHLAMVTLKTLMIRLLPIFKFSAPGKMPDLNFHADISVRLRDGYNVNISRR